MFSIVVEVKPCTSRSYATRFLRVNRAGPDASPKPPWPLARWPASSRNGDRLEIGDPTGFGSVELSIRTPACASPCAQTPPTERDFVVIRRGTGRSRLRRRSADVPNADVHRFLRLIPLRSWAKLGLAEGGSWKRGGSVAPEPYGDSAARLVVPQRRVSAPIPAGRGHGRS